MCFVFNPLNATLNPICHLLALLGAHHILHVSRIRVKRLRIPHSAHRVNFWIRKMLKIKSDYYLKGQIKIFSIT